MDIEQAFFSEPGDGLLHEMRTKEELIAFQQKYETGFTLTDKEAEILVNYMDGHDYILGEDDGKLYRGDLDEKPGEVCWEEYSMDDAIDAVCEWNYELILDADAKRTNPSDFVDFSNSQSWYEGLKEEEKILDKLFDQTKYGKGMEELAQKLANQVIESISKADTKEESIEAVVAAVSEQVKQYSIGGRSR